MMVLLMILCCQDLKRGIVMIISNWLCDDGNVVDYNKRCPTSFPPLVVKRGTSPVTTGSASEWRRDVIRLYHPVIMSSCHLQLADWTMHIFSQGPDCLDKSEPCHPRPILPTTINHNQQLPTTINHNQPPLNCSIKTTDNHRQPGARLLGQVRRERLRAFVAWGRLQQVCDLIHMTYCYNKYVIKRLIAVSHALLLSPLDLANLWNPF